ncbi:YdcF family protein [Nostoc sp. FACHB-152]|uniref:YdcF family protein n=1 Tax=unclassified Nostoc TaxID=2593658 RepID=UPI001685537D|nr:MULTISPECIES: YdcF family protein [unclassified Nostoc]MBD2446598.1 YdcF family protein [Nostoc sp. FACHB-152]MBD2466446.1 YdcF family protein [Nostoc sp. FACHB-145]
MTHKFTHISSIFSERRLLKWWQLLQKVSRILCLLFGCWLIFTTITLVSASSRPVDALFVLGGSIRREIYVAQQTKQNPQIPILISSGSPDPCIWLIFQREAAALQNVWLENCADSTFDNFYYGIPILRRWGVHKVKLISSPSHFPRAKWMAQILFGAHGIWIEPEVVQEKGRPGNREFGWKTGFDIARSLIWAVLSQVSQPQCSHITKLTDVDMEAWQRQGFKCERQGGVGMKKAGEQRSRRAREGR